MAPLKRPFATHYYDTASATAPMHIGHGAASEQGAIRAAVVRLFLGQYQRCVVLDRATGAALYTITRNRREGLRVHYGAGVPLKHWEQ